MPHLPAAFTRACSATIHSVEDHLKNVCAAARHPISAISEDRRCALMFKTAGAAACTILILAETSPAMAAVAGFAALDPVYEAFHSLDHAGALWRSIHEHQPQLPY